MSGRAKPIHLAAHFPGVNNTTVWSDPEAGSHIEFSSFTHLARTAERAKFDFFFLAEGLRLREQRGRIHDLDVVGRPDTFAVLAALAAVTDRIGLAGTINSTFNEPYEVARQFASLDHHVRNQASNAAKRERTVIELGGPLVYPDTSFSVNKSRSGSVFCGRAEDRRDDQQRHPRTITTAPALAIKRRVCRRVAAHADTGEEVLRAGRRRNR